MNMKKLVALLLALVMVFALCACGGDKDNGGKDSATYKVAMITDYGDITDQSFNQTTYEACKAFCTENNIEFTYYEARRRQPRRTVSPWSRRPLTRATMSS